MRLRFDILYWTELLHEFTELSYNEIARLYTQADKICWEYGKKLNLDLEQDRLKYYNQVPLLIGYVNWHLNVARKKRKDLADKLYGRVLDYGCGIATQSLIANVERGVRIELYDIDTITKGFLKYIIEKHNLNNLRLIDKNYDMDIGLYDCIVCTDVLEHINNPIEVLNEFKELMHPKSKLFIRAPFNEGQDPTHIHNDKTIAQLCEEAGIKQENVEEVEI